MQLGDMCICYMHNLSPACAYHLDAIPSHCHKSQTSKLVHDATPTHGGLCPASPQSALDTLCEFRPTSYFEIRRMWGHRASANLIPASCGRLPNHFDVATPMHDVACSSPDRSPCQDHHHNSKTIGHRDCSLFFSFFQGWYPALGIGFFLLSRCLEMLITYKQIHSNINSQHKTMIARLDILYRQKLLSKFYHFYDKYSKNQFNQSRPTDRSLQNAREPQYNIQKNASFANTLVTFSYASFVSVVLIPP